jgi:hypothetical protein
MQENYGGMVQYPVTSQEFARDGGRNLRGFHFLRKFRTCASGNVLAGERVSVAAVNPLHDFTRPIMFSGLLFSDCSR